MINDEHPLLKVGSSGKYSICFNKKEYLKLNQKILKIILATIISKYADFGGKYKVVLVGKLSSG